MKKTKKMPIFLASLTLGVTGLGVNWSAGALEGVQQELMTIAREAADGLSLETNAADAYLKMNLIKYGAGSANGVVSAPDDGDYYIKKIVVAYMNFSQGVSEEEADENLANLIGSGDPDWNVVSLYENYLSAAKKTQNISLNRAQTGRDIFANKSDILYYAVEFGEIADGGWANTWWSRGKIDYRSCVHSSVFDMNTMSCTRVEDGGVVKYLPQVNGSNKLVEIPENEEVISWEEEWRDVILADYEGVQNEIEQMWGYLNDGPWILDQNDLVLDGILKSVTHYDAADSKLLWIAQGADFWKGRITELRKFFEKTDTTDTSKLEVLEKENESLKQINEELETEKAGLKQENEGLKSEKTELEAKNETLRYEKETLEKEVLRLQKKNETLKALGGDSGKESSDQENSAEMSEIKSLKQEIEKMAKEMTEMQQNIGQMETEKAELGAKNSELQQTIEELQNRQESVGDWTCENVSSVTEVKIVNNNEEKAPDDLMKNDTEKVGNVENMENMDNTGVDVPNLGEKEVRTSGVWWWLIPVVGLAGMVVLLAKRKFSRE